MCINDYYITFFITNAAASARYRAAGRERLFSCARYLSVRSITTSSMSELYSTILL
jgi:hypothetical protein